VAEGRGLRVSLQTNRRKIATEFSRITISVRSPIVAGLLLSVWQLEIFLRSQILAQITRLRAANKTCRGARNKTPPLTGSCTDSTRPSATARYPFWRNEAYHNNNVRVIHCSQWHSSLSPICDRPMLNQHTPTIRQSSRVRPTGLSIPRSQNTIQPPPESRYTTQRHLVIRRSATSDSSERED
jgi:hypothetical protein